MREPGHIKREPRIGIQQRMVLVDDDGSERPVTLTDISSSGFRLQTERDLPIGAVVVLRGQRCGDVPAQIRWAVNQEAGGIFLQPAAL
jgi:hypothetical protein